MTNRKKTLYFAYGMNTNLDSMARRCPAAKSLGKITLEGYKFVFRGVGDVIYTGKLQDKIEGAAWLITEECEKSLDRLEGFPSFYGKVYEPILFNGKPESIMIYQMTKQNARGIYDPSESYWNMLFEGYASHKMNHDQMYSGLPTHSKYKSVEHIKARRRYKNKQNALWQNINLNKY
jgi:gamma-glutamylcyclotransferase (GGCT)/AIG2-like uncharacterized protein YtfP